MLGSTETTHGETLTTILTIRSQDTSRISPVAVRDRMCLCVSGLNEQSPRYLSRVASLVTRLWTSWYACATGSGSLRIASDSHGVLDPRYRTAKFALGYGLSMYWETLSRWISHRSRRDARELGLPLVFLQAVDECNTNDRSAAQRLLNIPNMHCTGHIHGVLPAHVGMRERIAVKVNSMLGLVQEQRATIVDFVFKEEDRARYNRSELLPYSC